MIPDKSEFQDLVEIFTEMIGETIKNTFIQNNFEFSPEGFLLKPSGEVVVLIFDPEFVTSNANKDVMMETLISYGKQIKAPLMAIASDSYIGRIKSEDKEKYKEYINTPPSTWPDEIKSEALMISVFGENIAPQVTSYAYTREILDNGDTVNVIWEDDPLSFGEANGIATGRMAPRL